ARHLRGVRRQGLSRYLRGLHGQGGGLGGHPPEPFGALRQELTRYRFANGFGQLRRSGTEGAAGATGTGDAAGAGDASAGAPLRCASSTRVTTIPSGVDASPTIVSSPGWSRARLTAAASSARSVR